MTWSHCCRDAAVVVLWCLFSVLSFVLSGGWKIAALADCCLFAACLYFYGFPSTPGSPTRWVPSMRFGDIGPTYTYNLEMELYKLNLAHLNRSGHLSASVPPKRQQPILLMETAADFAFFCPPQATDEAQ